VRKISHAIGTTERDPGAYPKGWPGFRHRLGSRVSDLRGHNSARSARSGSSGTMSRVYGGALAMSSASGSAQQRRRRPSTESSLLGKRWLRSCDRVNSCLSTPTNLAAARSLPEGIGATVVAHDPVIASILAGRTDLPLITIGGQVNPLVGAAVDGQALRVILDMRPDLLFLGLCAIDAQNGIAVFIAKTRR
jgi:DeoR/GlpR family transcriptional regulator of sugar metabolism